jgi:hypothetical protein
MEGCSKVKFVFLNLSKGILVRHTSLIESELKTPSNVTRNRNLIIIGPITSHIGRSL